MDDLTAIPAITSWETAKAKRAARKGKLTRLAKRLDEHSHTALHEQQTFTISKLRDDIFKEKRLHEALQNRCEQLMEGREGVSEEQMTREIEAGEEASEIYADILHRADVAQVTLTHYIAAQSIQRDYDTLVAVSDPTIGEFEEDCGRLQKRFSVYLTQIASFNQAEIRNIHERFIRYESDIATRLSESRGLRKRSKENNIIASIDSAKPARSSTLRLELPDFSGHPLDWHHFHELFTSALERAGSEFSDREKTCFLLKSMKTTEAKQIVKSYAAVDDGYIRALKALIQRFGSAKKVFPHLVHKMTSKEPINLTQEGFSRYRDKYILPLQSMQELGCTSISQFAASLALENFSQSLRDEWTKFYKTVSEVPLLEDITEFLEPLENNLQSLTLDDGKVTTHLPSQSRRSYAAVPKVSNSVCALCKEIHRLFRCPVFSGYDTTRRNRYVRDKRLCCKSTFTCKECRGKHHTLLHRSTNPPATMATESAPNLMAVDRVETTLTSQEAPPQVSFLHTAMAKATHHGRETLVRAALDTGASSSLITEKVASQRLSITGACGKGISKYFVELTLQSTLDETKKMTTKFNVVRLLPRAPSPLNTELIKQEVHIQGLPLADPEFGGQLDALIGGIDYNECVVGSITKGSTSSIAAQPTIFGWTVTGPLEQAPHSASFLQIHTEQDTLHKDLSFLWEIDRTPEQTQLNPEAEEVRQHFLDTHKIDIDGRYVVKLPRISNPPVLGSSRNLAMRRCLQNMKSLDKKGKSVEFNAALSEYIHLGHAEEVPNQQLPSNHYYLPVHGVFKQSSTTTKVRPVFDASAPSSTGASLNDTLEQGPNLYPLLSDVLLKFRIHKIGFSADISKMFREIKLHEEEKDFHRYLWQDSQGTIKDVRMNRLTFGVRSSPYLATQVIRHHAETHLDTHPLASKAILDSFYVDDYLSGTPSVEEAQKIRVELCDLLKIAGMTLRKWRSSDQSLIKTIPTDLIETENLLISPSDKPIKALGLHWDVSQDSFNIATPKVTDQQVTKRTIASNLGKVYDILGFFSPVTITGKILLKQLWQLQLGWDATPPSQISETWKGWLAQLEVLASHPIPRRYSLRNDVAQQSLHGFADASQDAYGAVIYLKITHSDDTATTSIVMSKARVVPLKGLTIPRAELTAAHMMAKLLKYCSRLLDVHSMTAWSDSSIVLCWLRKTPNSLNTFVANRVHSINTLVPNAQWRHVSSALNPADMLTNYGGKAHHGSNCHNESGQHHSLSCQTPSRKSRQLFSPHQSPPQRSHGNVIPIFNMH